MRATPCHERKVGMLQFKKRYVMDDSQNVHWTAILGTLCRLQLQFQRPKSQIHGHLSIDLGFQGAGYVRSELKSPLLLRRLDFKIIISDL